MRPLGENTPRRGGERSKAVSVVVGRTTVSERLSTLQGVRTRDPGEKISRRRDAELLPRSLPVVWAETWRIAEEWGEVAEVMKVVVVVAAAGGGWGEGHELEKVVTAPIQNMKKTRAGFWAGWVVVEIGY